MFLDNLCYSVYTDFMSGTHLHYVLTDFKTEERSRNSRAVARMLDALLRPPACLTL
jgi:hypothetical protein